MSSEAWGIVGFGLKVEQSMLDWQKCAELIKERYDESVTEPLQEVTNEDEFYKFLNWADIYYDGLLKEFVEGEKHIGYIGGSDSDEGDFILFFPGYPWEYDEEDLKITEDMAKEKIYNCLKPYLKDNITRKEILEQIDYVSTYGIG